MLDCITELQKRLEKYLLDKELSQEKFGSDVGLAQTTVSKFLRHGTGLISTAQKIDQHLISKDCKRKA